MSSIFTFVPQEPEAGWTISWLNMHRSIPAIVYNN